MVSYYQHNNSVYCVRLYRVNELREFGYIVPPAQVGHLQNNTIDRFNGTFEFGHGTETRHVFGLTANNNK